MSKQVSNTVLRAIIAIDLFFAIPIALFMGFFGTVFTDGPAHPSAGIVMGLFTLVLLSIPAIICWMTLRKRPTSNQSNQSFLKTVLWVLGFVFLSIPTLLFWVIAKDRNNISSRGRR